MAVTVANVDRPQISSFTALKVSEVTCDASYPTGGYALTAAQLGLGRVSFALCNVKTTAAAGATVQAWYDPVNALLKLNAAAAEVANASNVATLVVEVVAFGSL